MSESKIKSARTIEDPSEIAEIMRRRLDAGTLRVEESSDGRLEVFKSGAASLTPDAKAAPSAADLQKLAEGVGLTWRDEYATRVVPYIASDERVDRHGDIVRQVWDFREFAQNPIVLFGHNWGGMPIGNSIRWEVRNRVGPGYSGPALEMWNLFATEDENPEAESVFRLVKSGMMRSSSVGFYAKRVTVVQDEEERRKLGLGKYGVIFEESTLIEHSPVSVPANVGATVVAEFAKHAKPGDIDLIRESCRVDALIRGMSARHWESIDASLRFVWSRAFADFRAVPCRIDTPVERGEVRKTQVQKTEPEPESRVESMLVEVLGELRAMRGDLDSGLSEIRDLVSGAVVEEPANEGGDDAEPISALSSIMESSAFESIDRAAKAFRGPKS